MRRLFRSRLARCIGTLLGGALLLGYVLPLYVPPDSPRFTQIIAETPLIARMFPAVPSNWVLARLLCLALAAGLLVAGRPRRVPISLAPARSNLTGLATEPGPLTYAALAVALFYLLTAIFVESLSPMGQLYYLILFTMPALLVWLEQPRERERLAPLGTLIISGVVAGLWVGFRLWVGWRSPRLAASIDGWDLMLQAVERATDGASLLATSPLPGYTHAPALLMGAANLAASPALPFVPWMQLLNTGWMYVAALETGWLASVTLGRSAAVVVLLAFLFAPMTLFLQLSLIPWGLFLALQGALLVLLLKFHRRPSPVLLVALATACGLATVSVLLLVPAALVGAATLCIVRRRRVPLHRAHCAVALVIAIAGAWALLPRPSEIPQIWAVHMTGRGDAAQMEKLAQGQLSLSEALNRRDPGPLPWRTRLALPLAAVLMPFAAQRSPLRLSGDVLFEPFASCLVAIALVALLRAARRQASARLMLLLLIIALLPAMIGSAAGHVAACRAFLMTMVVPLFAGVGFAFVRRHHVRPSLAPLWLAASVLVPVSGTVLFDVVNPSVLSSSAQALTADLLGDRDPATHAVVLDSRVDVHGRALTWLRLREVAERLPRTPLATRSYIDDQSLLDMPGDPPIDIFAWSPALEADRRVGEGMCTRFPEARLFVVTDGARRSRLLVAAPRSRDWSPALPPHRWVRLDCPQLAASGWPSLGPLPREIRLRIVGNQLRDMAR